jgi:hypothetical protein
MLLAAVLALNPVGLDFVRAAFLAGEQLSGNIAQPIVLAALAIFGRHRGMVRAFSSEVGTGSREENASEQEN